MARIRSLFTRLSSRMSSSSAAATAPSPAPAPPLTADERALIAVKRQLSIIQTERCKPGNSPQVDAALKDAMMLLQQRLVQIERGGDVPPEAPETAESEKTPIVTMEEFNSACEIAAKKIVERDRRTFEEWRRTV
ncbi:hypothetical protein FN846DRAFT_893033 [Sphaerosporella brunnea]|uniref:Uncharacterized protein n=1 Tax=Sphaerosporella brunnea TaxID=1250544 RepID=A0A5J5ELZ2_9PEZI|nr:hypothetical protein FN846DRAFT_893033 [Sphaerosporella brunnea]